MLGGKAKRPRTGRGLFGKDMDFRTLLLARFLLHGYWTVSVIVAECDTLTPLVVVPVAVIVTG